MKGSSAKKSRKHVKLQLVVQMGEPKEFNYHNKNGRVCSFFKGRLVNTSSTVFPTHGKRYRDTNNQAST